MARSSIEYYGFDPDDEAEVMKHATAELAEKMFRVGDDKRAQKAINFILYCSRQHEVFLSLDQLRFIYHPHWNWKNK